MKFILFSIMFSVLLSFLAFVIQTPSAATEKESSPNDHCIKCHLEKTPQIVTDWKPSALGHKFGDVFMILLKNVGIHVF